MQKLLTFFSKNISIYAISNDQSFNDMLTNDFISFEQLGPGDLKPIKTSPLNLMQLQITLSVKYHSETYNHKHWWN